MKSILLLNASYEPLHLVPVKRAITLVMTGKVSVLETTGGVWHSEKRTFEVPRIIRLNRMVKVPYGEVPRFTRKGVLIRDGFKCLFCGEHASTVDHLLPRSRGGADSWTNCVSCCWACNNIKDDRTPQEMGWVLRRAPFTPSGRLFLLLLCAHPIAPEWVPYLDGWLPVRARPVPALTSALVSPVRAPALV